MTARWTRRHAFAPRLRAYLQNIRNYVNFLREYIAKVKITLRDFHRRQYCVFTIESNKSKYLFEPVYLMRV